MRADAAVKCMRMIVPPGHEYSRDLQSKGSPLCCRIHGRMYKLCFAHILCICGCVHTNETALLFQLLQIDFSRFKPQLFFSALFLHPLSATVLAPALWHVGCRWLFCLTVPGQGQVFPVNYCHNLSHDMLTVTSPVQSEHRPFWRKVCWVVHTLGRFSTRLHRKHYILHASQQTVVHMMTCKQD